MKKISGKDIARQQLQRQVEEFIDRGGEVTHVPQGDGGWDNSKGALKPSQTIFDGTPKQRTPLDHLLKSIDSRRAKKRAKPKQRARLPQPRKQAIYDDFGEPIRYIWVDK